MLYLSADPVLRVNLLEQYAFANTVPFVFQLKDSTHVCHGVLNFMQPQMTLVSFGLGALNAAPGGKSLLLDKAFLLNLTSQFDPQHRATFQSGSVDMQMSLNLFSRGTAE